MLRVSFGSLLVLLLLAIVPLAAGARRRAPRAPREKSTTVGDALDIGGDPDYLGYDWQAVCVLTPGSANRRIVTKEGKMVGMRRRRGMVTWLKKKSYWPWEKPWDDVQRSPFKVRYLKEDPKGVMLSMAQQKQLQLGMGEYKGRQVVSVKLIKPRAWWKFWPAPEE